MPRVTLARALTFALLMTAIACGGGGDGGGSTPTTPTPTPTPTPNPTPAPTPSGGTTITITAAGVSPRDLTVPLSTRVTFVNNDTRPHEMNSDPHPEHGDCPEIDNVGFLSPGQSRETTNMVTPRTCGYHDHNQPTNQSLLGRIIVLP